MTKRDDDLRAVLLSTFRVEAAEHLDSLRGQLLALESAAQPAAALELTETTFRTMHTLKGAARSVGLLDVERRCSECEALLSGLTRGGTPPGPDDLARLETGVADIAGLLEGETAPPPVAPPVARAAAEPAPAEPRPVAEPVALPRAGGADGTIRISAAKLDALLLLGEELLALKLAADDRVHESDALAAEIRRLRSALDGDRPLELDAELRAVEAGARALHEALQRDRRVAGAAVDALLDEARRTRMMPAATVLDLFPRMVRDLAASEGREARWSARGTDLQIDRKVLEALKDPLIHLVRNAVGHGIEPPDAREAAGKPRRGRVTATVTSVENSRIEIVVEDDGRGIDLAQVRDAAVRSRVVDRESAAAMPDSAALDLIYRSGLSTRFVITDVAGHGLGLAIVREAVERLEGSIAVESRPGSGTAVRMTVPAAIATFRGLLVRAAGRPFLISVGAVERAVALNGETATYQGREAIRIDGEALRVAPLGELLGMPPTDAPSVSPACVIVGAGAGRAGLLVDELLGDTEVLVKELGPPLSNVRHVAGAGLLGSGDIVLILRPADLVAAVSERRTAPAPAGDVVLATPHVLVVDDALTTRTMERSLLEAAGYEVTVAVDGMDAWSALQGAEFDLVVSDVDMPRMDGFELTSRIRADARLADLPVVLVTALESRADEERGIEVGANAYVMKSSFDQSNLLEIIRRIGVRVPEASAR